MAKDKKSKPISVYFPVPKLVAKNLEARRVADDRSANDFIRRLIEARIATYKKTKNMIPVTQTEADEIGQFVRLPQELIDDIDQIAASHDRTRTRMVRHMVIAELEDATK